MSVWSDLRVMHVKFNFKRSPTPAILPKEQHAFRMDFLVEELQETIEAAVNDDLEGVIDGLIDLIVVAAGTLDLMGVRSEKHWREVHYCNMNKQVATKEQPSKRGSTSLDLVKPKGWVGPNHSKLLEMEGYE